MERQVRTLAAGLALFALAAAAAGCDRGRDSADTEASTAARSAQPAEQPRFGLTALENLRLVPVEVEVPGLPAGWDGARLAALSDLQLGMWEENERIAAAAVQRAADSGAEAVLLLGGYLADPQAADALRRALAPLRGRQAVAILSLYDQRDEEIAAANASALEAQGIAIARNGRVPLVRGGDTLHVAGLAANFAWMESWQQATVLDTLGTRTTPILLTPFPELLPRAPEGRYALVLAGRTFCGEVEIPGTARLAALDAEQLAGTRVAGHERLYQVRGNPLLITCGTGYTFVPARIGAPAEVLLITLRRSGDPAAEEPADTLAAPDTVPAPADTIE